MFINLKIDNIDKLPNGGPLVYSSHARGFEIGRENRDWTLPDPDKFISGRHCEVRYENGTFWLYDVSRNGTFVNGASQRISGPYKLGHGDRLRIGPYIVSVSISDRQPELEPQREQVPGRPARVIMRPSAAASGPMQADEMLRRIAAGAGVSPEVFLQRDPREIADEIGAILRTMVDELSVLLRARAAAKMMVKSSDRTMIGSTDNNPLKFVPGSEDILEIMFARRRAGYLDARSSVEDAFRDLKTHEFTTYAAMQAALSRLLDELSPDAIEKRLPPSSFVSKKGRAWDMFTAIWAARESAHENGMLDVFLAYFSEAYAKAAKPK
ncbi:type VI secretion system-associated FHA domain protein TagH [Mesorhizobium sp. 1B3]|uniref:type VI secretion system-associated FHA domain protein TagH n=1 Tax=Mesorhizobium sp. 1B3 TaxID=3243599 RepID=UPI003D98E847